MSEVKVLVIDDNEIDQKMISRVLNNQKNSPYKIIAVDSGEEALGFLKTHEVNCILLDYMLTDTDGISLLKELRTKFKNFNTPIIMLTGQGSEKIAVSAMRLGADDYLIKDEINTRDLHKVIFNVLKKHHLEKKMKDNKRN